MLLITPTHEVLLVSGLFRVPIGQGVDRDDARRIARAYRRLPDLGKYNMMELENGSERAEDDSKWMEQQAERELFEKEEGEYGHD